MLTWLKSRRVHYLIGVCFMLLFLMLALRGIFLFGFSEIGDTVHASGIDLAKVLYIGSKFDLRLAILLTLPLVVLAYWPRINLTRSSFMRLLAKLYLVATVSALLTFYALDFGHYAYLGIRVNSTVLRFLGDFSISRDMVWQSYPVIWSEPFSTRESRNTERTISAESDIHRFGENQIGRELYPFPESEP